MHLMLRIAAAAGLLIAAPAAAQVPRQPAPPESQLWRMDRGGDAVQTDLGFRLPARIGRYERKGFTSTRPDGTSVMTWYESRDRAISLRILLQLRPDVRGVPLPGDDALDRTWRFLELAERMEHEAPAEELSRARFAWGRGQPVNAIARLARYRRPDGPIVHGTWYRNIGLWAVAISAVGPEARRADIEAAGRAAMAIRWPMAPLTADLRAMAPEFLAALPDCPGFPRDGSGEPVEPHVGLTTTIGLGLSANFLEGAADNGRLSFAHPVADARPYCRIETFRSAGREMVALGWRGEPTGDAAARYAFMLPDGSLFLQVETMFGPDALAPEDRRGIRRLVWMTVGDDRRVSAVQAFSDWPSYASARALAEAASGPSVTTIASVANGDEGLEISVSPGPQDRPRR